MFKVGAFTLNEHHVIFDSIDLNSCDVASKGVLLSGSVSNQQRTCGSNLAEFASNSDTCAVGRLFTLQLGSLAMVGQNEQEEEAGKGLHLTCRLATWQQPLSLYPSIEGDLVHKNGNVEGLSLFPDGVATNGQLATLSGTQLTSSLLREPAGQSRGESAKLKTGSVKQQTTREEPGFLTTWNQIEAMSKTY